MERERNSSPIPFITNAIEQRPFVAINCGAIPETLLESEVFWHEKGSFTGAHTHQKGRIESAHNGTLFLDKIGELPTALQIKVVPGPSGTLHRTRWLI